jgi:hypothetical protein
MSRAELSALVRAQARLIAEQGARIPGQDAQIADLMASNEALAVKLARLEHLLSRNSSNSSNPPSKDNDPVARRRRPRRVAVGRGASGGKQQLGELPGTAAETAQPVRPSRVSLAADIFTDEDGGSSSCLRFASILRAPSAEPTSDRMGTQMAAC